MFCVLDQNEFVKSIWKVNLSNLSHGGGFVGRTTRSALIVKSEVNTVFDSSFTLAYCRKNENLNQSANGEQSSMTMERLKANDSSSLVQFIYEIFNITETHSEM